MADLQDLNSGSGGAAALQCDRAIFTSLPSATGEGYRMVAWSTGLRPEERQELTRRAPSHGSLAGGQQGLALFQLQTTKRRGWALVRVAGAEHTQRGGGRVWTDFLLADAADAKSAAVSAAALRAAVAAEAPPKPPLGSSPLGRIGVSAAAQAGEPAAETARDAAAIAAVACLLLDGRTCVVAAGKHSHEIFENALRVIPASQRDGIDACGGLRYSPARGVRATVTDVIDQDVVRATRGQKIECIDLATKPPPLAGPIAAWLALAARWWSQGRAAEVVQLADRLGGAWGVEHINDVAEICEAIDRGDATIETLEIYLTRRSAA